MFVLRVRFKVTARRCPTESEADHARRQLDSRPPTLWYLRESDHTPPRISDGRETTGGEEKKRKKSANNKSTEGSTKFGRGGKKKQVEDEKRTEGERLEAGDRPPGRGTLRI